MRLHEEPFGLRQHTVAVPELREAVRIEGTDQERREPHPQHGKEEVEIESARFQTLNRIM